MKKLMMVLLSGTISISMLSGCGKTASKEESNDSTTITPTMSAEEPMSVVEESISEKSNDLEHPYLPAIQKSLDCIFNNDEEGYWNAQHSEYRRGYNECKFTHMFGSPVSDCNRTISKLTLTENIKNINEIDSNDDVGTADGIIKEAFDDINQTLKDCNIEPMNMNIQDYKLISFYLDSYDADQKSAHCLCLVYKVDNEWYSMFFEKSINPH